ncbi:MAG: hypothetical protein ABFD89_01935, partial [Bryobacteraceae bacterium]
MSIRRTEVNSEGTESSPGIGNGVAAIRHPSISRRQSEFAAAESVGGAALPSRHEHQLAEQPESI